MTQNNLIILAAGAVGIYLMLKSKNGSANTVNNLGAEINGISEIFTGAKPGQVGAGWRYFTDGSSISPGGVYYMNGVELWAPGKVNA